MRIYVHNLYKIDKQCFASSMKYKDQETTSKF